MSSFFTIPNAAKKRKRVDTVEPPKKRLAPQPKPAPRKPQRDESISGSEDESDDQEGDDANASVTGEGEESGEEETAAERRLRLAERYLSNIRSEVHMETDENYFDAEEIDRDLIAERLQEDVAESKGRIYRKLAPELDFQAATQSWFRWNSASVTSVATCAPYAYTATKDLGLAKWRIQELPENQWLPKTGKKQKKPPPPPKRKPEQLAFVKGDRTKARNDTSYQGHVDIIMTVVASEDGKFVVTGGKDTKIIVWDAATLKPLRVFNQHRDAVTGLAFRRGTNQLYSSSKDRTVKIWSLNELAYVETLFGHQDEVVDVAALAQERCLSVGARDRTARLWKVAEETQLVFRGGGGEKKSKHGNTPKEGSIDRVAMIDEEMFVTGSDNGSLSLWAIHKKKPVFTLSLCHGEDPPMKPDEASAETSPDADIVPQPQPRWITALATIPYSDVILSGSWDGSLRAWKVSDDKKRIERVGIVGSAENGHMNANVDSDKRNSQASSPSSPSSSIVRGVINDISIFERGDRGKDGVCVIVAVGVEHRLGRWLNQVEGKNGSVVFEIPRHRK